MFDKHRSQKQYSAFKRQRRPQAQTAHLSHLRPIPRRSLPAKAGSNCTCLRPTTINLLNGLVEVL